VQTGDDAYVRTPLNECFVPLTLRWDGLTLSDISAHEAAFYTNSRSS